MLARDLDQLRQLGGLDGPAADPAEPGQKSPVALDLAHDPGSVVVLDGGDQGGQTVPTVSQEDGVGVVGPVRARLDTGDQGGAGGGRPGPAHLEP